MSKPNEVKEALRTLANVEKISDYMRFFKTDVGEYGEGDKFLGISVPNIRKIVKDFRFTLSLEDVHELLYSPYHEERMFALLYLVAWYESKKTAEDVKEQIYTFYINHTSQINNWDLVDVTAPHIVGVHLLTRDRTILYDLANSNDLWKKRIAIVSTFAFIKAKEYEDTLNIAEILLNDKHDLIHKAVGWALRTVGNSDLKVELEFLKPRYKTMPRTMLRYAIEKFDEELRQAYLQSRV